MIAPVPPAAALDPLALVAAQPQPALPVDFAALIGQAAPVALTTPEPVKAPAAAVVADMPEPADDAVQALIARLLPAKPEPQQSPQAAAAPALAARGQTKPAIAPGTAKVADDAEAAAEPDRQDDQEAEASIAQGGDAGLVAAVVPEPDTTPMLLPTANIAAAANTAPAPRERASIAAVAPGAGMPARAAPEAKPRQPAKMVAADDAADSADQAAAPAQRAADQRFASLLQSAQPSDAASATATRDVAAPAPAEILIAHKLDLAQGDAWLDRLAQDISRTADQDARLRFALAPEHLGRLTVDLASGANGTAIRLTTESEQAHRIVSDAQPRLIAEARAQGLRISDTQVDLGQRPGGQPQQQPSSMAEQGGQERPRPNFHWAEQRRPLPMPAADDPRAAQDLYA